MGEVVRNSRLAAPRAPLSLAEKRSHLDELRTQAMFSDSDLLSRRIRDLEAQIEHETGRRAGARHAATQGPRAVEPATRPLRGPRTETGRQNLT